MTGTAESARSQQFGVALARAYGGAVVFSLPLLMTMEMWWLGFFMDRLRLALLMLLMLPLLIGLDHFSGFRETTRWSEDVVDGLVAYGVGLTASAAVLLLFGVLGTATPPGEVVGKVALQAVPAGFGAVLAGSQFGGGNHGGEGQSPERRDPREASYGAELFFMLGGAVFLAFNVAPTEEMMLISFKMTAWHSLALVAVSLALMHGFVYAVNFRGAPAVPVGTPGWSLFLRFTLVGYALALLVSAYMLWTFERVANDALVVSLQQAIVLAFPASLGAAAARLIL